MAYGPNPRSQPIADRSSVVLRPYQVSLFLASRMRGTFMACFYMSQAGVCCCGSHRPLGQIADVSLVGTLRCRRATSPYRVRSVLQVQTATHRDPFSF